MQKIKVVLPAYNEEDDLPKLLVRLDKSMEKLESVYKTLLTMQKKQNQTTIILMTSLKTLMIHQHMK